MVAHPYNPSSREVEAGGSEIQSQPEGRETHLQKQRELDEP